jgi:DNA modification methylase
MAMAVLSTTHNTNLDGLVHSHCINVLSAAPAGSVDLIITDPPYIARYRSRDGREIRNDASAEWATPSRSASTA